MADEGVCATTSAKGGADSLTADRVTLEIKGAKLNVAIQNALKRRRSHDKLQAQEQQQELENEISGQPNSTRHAPHADDGGGGMDGRAPGGERRGCFGSSGGGALAACRDAGSAKEVALLKAAAESLRAGLREKEDSLTELEREKEGLLEQAASLESTMQENVQLAQKIVELEGQVERLHAKLEQAEAGRALTMTLVDTLKSAQNDVVSAHEQVAQRCNELENMAEDSAQALRRGDALLHRQQLKIDAQSRQIKRQEEDLATLREERELQLTKADRSAAELAQVLRRERAGQGSIADAQAEVEELNRELDHMREAFARHRNVMRKNQDVIDAHEKALQDARSELLSLSLEAEKQSARHQQAAADAASEKTRVMADKDTALREVRLLRVEREDLKDKLEEAERKLNSANNTGTAAAAAAAVASNNTKLHGFHKGNQNRTSPKINPVGRPGSTPFHQVPPQDHVQPLFGKRTGEQRANCPPPSAHDRSDSGSTQRDNLSITRPRRMESVEASKFSESSSAGLYSQRHGEENKSNSATRIDTDMSSPADKRNKGGETPGTPPTSAADAGGGGGGDAGGGDGAGAGNPGDSHSGSSVDRATSVRGRTNHIPASDECDRRVDKNENTVRGGCGDDGHDGGDGARASSDPRSRPHPPDRGNGHGGNRLVEVEGWQKGGRHEVARAPSCEVSRKRARNTVGSDTHDDGEVFATESTEATTSSTHSRHHFEIGNSGIREKASPRDAAANASKASDKRHLNRGALSPRDVPNTCPSCGDSPYGLMINCSGCLRQHHSSCVPDGQRVGKGLGAVFHCSKCSSSEEG